MNIKLKTEAILSNLFVCYPVLEVCRDAVFKAVQEMIISYRRGGKLLVCGNGGSAADSLHMVAELMKAFVLPRSLSQDDCNKIYEVSPDTADYLVKNLQQALPAISLVSETALFTAYANDMAPNLSFAQQVLSYGKEDDILFAISTSGNSANVIYAAQVARVRGMKIIVLTGETGGKLRAWADVLVNVPSSITYQIQEYHLPIYHVLCLALENEFFGED